MKKIPLSQGLFAMVDDEDFDELIKYKWSVERSKTTFYAARHSPMVNGKRFKIKMHRQILGISDRSIFCDHIDGNGLNNQRQNLRPCVQAENLRNQQMRSDNTSGYKGVTFDKRKSKWMAQIHLNRKCIFIGYFKCPKVAAHAYDAAAKIHHGEFARLNF